MSGHHGRDQWQTLTLAATKDGTVTGLKVDLLADLGAYVALLGGGVPVLGAWMYNAIYKFPAYQFNCQTVLTNKTWVDAYRGAGRPEATYAIERLMDELAAEVGVDPLAIREKNWITHEEFPFASVAGMTYDSRQLRGRDGAGQGALPTTTSSARSSAAVARRTTPSSSGSASRPSPRCAVSRPRGSSGRSTTAPEGGSTRASGCSPRARSRSSRVRPRTVRATRRRGARSSPTGSVSRSRTSRSSTGTPRSPRRASTPTARDRSSSAARRSSRQPTRSSRRRGRSPPTCSRRASTTSSSSAGRFGVKGTDKGITLGEVALAAFTGHDLPDGVEPSLDADATVDAYTFSFPHGTHLCAVEVDTETGATRMRSYVAVDDIGTIVNPLIVAGQEHGGIVQGIAQALWEGAEYDENGTLVTGSFVDYTLPTAADTISFVTDHTVTPSTTNTLGTKGVGETGAHRVDTGGRQRHRRRRAPPRRERHPRCPAPRSGCGRPSRARGRTRADHGEAQPHFAEGAPNQDPSAGATDGVDQ